MTARPATADQASPSPVDAAGARGLPTLHGCAVGRALAAVRVRSGMPVGTLALLLDRAPADVLDMEDGRAAVSVGVLDLWCDQLRVPAASVLAWAAHIAPPEIRGWVIDLRAAADLPTGRSQPTVRKLALWARVLRGEDSDRPFLAMPEPEIRSLATLWSVPVGELIELLADLTPLALVPWQQSEQDRAASGAVQAWHARPRRHCPPTHDNASALAPVSALASDLVHARRAVPASGNPDEGRSQRPDDAERDTRARIRYPLAARVGLLLRRERLARGRDLASLARALHVSTSHICRVELARTEPKRSFLARWCTELGIRLSDLLHDAENSPTGATGAPAMLPGPVKSIAAAAAGPAAPHGLGVPAWTVPVYRTSPAPPQPVRTGTRCLHHEVQTQVERLAGRPADVTRCVTCGRPVPIPTTLTPSRARTVSCPLPPDVMVLEDGVIAL